MKGLAWLLLMAAFAAGAQSTLPNIEPEAQERFKRAVSLSRTQPDRAVALFETLAREYPGWPEPYNNLAVLYARQGQEKKAEQALLAAMETHPSYARVHKNLETLYAAMAGRAYRKALEGEGAGSEAPKLALADDIGFATVGSAPVGQTAGAAPALAVESEPALILEPKVAEAGPPPKPEPRPAPAVEVAAAPPAVAENKPAESQETVRQTVLSTVASWLEAWSSQDVERYLSFYGHHFDPGGGRTRARWEAIRRQRVGRPEFIDIEIQNPSVTFPEENRAVVRFLQTYRSNTFEGRTIKTLRLSRGDDGWKIVREETGG